MLPKVSIITAVYNDAGLIEDAIRSVMGQTYKNIEHLIIDGSSTDGTLDVIKRYGSSTVKWVSEPDKGIYDAMNKGIRLATGNFIGILHSDDLFAHNKVIEQAVFLMKECAVDSCYGDIVFIDRNNSNRIVRYWRAGPYRKQLFEKGWMPPHPTFFCKRSVYEKYGYFNLDFPLAADYELMLRFLYKHNVSTAYIPEVLVHMRTGGTSKPGRYTIGAIKENYRAWKVNDLKPRPTTFILKPLSKIFQYAYLGKMVS